MELIDCAPAAGGRKTTSSGDSAPGDASVDLALQLHQQGRHALKLNEAAKAVELLQRALSLDSSSPTAHLDLGNGLSVLGRHEGALASYDAAIALAPGIPQAHNNRGNALRKLQRLEVAVASFDQAIALDPGYAVAYHNRGATLVDLQRYDAALASFDAALALRPDNAETHNSRGNALRGLERYGTAIASYARAVSIRPDFPAAHTNLGVALAAVKRFEDAVASFDRAIALDNKYAEAYDRRGAVLFDLRQFEAAIASFDKAFKLNPGLRFSAGLRLLSQLQLCKWDSMDEEIGAIASRIDRNEPAASPFVVMAMSDSAALQRRAAEILVHARFAANDGLPAIAKYARHERIRVGYFSADFRDHPVSRLLAQSIEAHDRSKFEVTAFSFGPGGHDGMRARLEKSFDRFIDICTRSDRDVALLARRMELDIAVDLGGFTTDTRTRIFAMRAAPLQVNYLGYPGTMGAAYIDYLIADHTVVPDESRDHYREKIIYLPKSYLPTDSAQPIANRLFTRAELGLPAAGFVFCCFNNAFKISQVTFDAWMDILRRVDGSVLWLSEISEASMVNLRMEAVRSHVEAGRLIFAKRVASHAEHLARQRAADLFLDTFPYNAHATAHDALSAGLPVLTRAGEGFAARVAASLLHAIGLPELVTSTRSEYVELAVELAAGRQRLDGIRRRLAETQFGTPSFGVPFVSCLEAGYTSIYERYQADRPAEHIDLEAR
jgi:predicted O-linked N-acetylglucosamine transferase (SPINDLY family)